ncbi:MAG: hypothetical protein PF487_00720 [Bacteroidales bacterium]|jgi:hypothetical protein|nr:hypothetical protein [Bacteroidales bacterium]
MKNILIAYQISGQTVGVDLTSWKINDLNGNPPFTSILSGITMPNNYININTIENWNNYGYGFVNDYSVIKFAIKDIVISLGWTGLTNIEKDLAIKYYSYPDSTTAVIYLITEKGMTMEQAQGFVLQSWHKHHLKNIIAYTQRWNYAKLTVLQYLSRVDGEDLFNTVKTLINLYIEVGILGYDFNDNQDGIMDYIYSKHGFTGQGLEENGYTLQYSTWIEFKNGLNDVLVNGIYYKYTNSDLE